MGRGCRAPSCRCISPCDAYYGERYEEEDDRDYCPHCGIPDPWPPYASRICHSCNRGALVETFTSSSTHRARKKHGYIIQPGDIYKRVVAGGYEVEGPRWLTVRKELVRKASDLERLAAAKFMSPEEGEDMEEGR